MKKMHLAALASIGTFGMVATASAAHIDLFDSGATPVAADQMFNVVSPNNLDPDDMTNNNTIGTPGDASTRTVEIRSVLGGPTSFAFDGDAATGAVYTGAPGSVGVVTFTYNNFASPGGSDFLNIRDGSGTDIGLNWDSVQFTFSDFENLQVIASLTDADGTEFDHSIATLMGTGNGNTDVFTLNYADFLPDLASPGTTAGLDLENISEFAFTFGVPSFALDAPADEQSFRLVDIRRAGAVPVPASLLLLVAGLGGLVARRKLAA